MPLRPCNMPMLRRLCHISVISLEQLVCSIIRCKCVLEGSGRHHAFMMIAVLIITFMQADAALQSCYKGVKYQYWPTVLAISARLAPLQVSNIAYSDNMLCNPECMQAAQHPFHLGCQSTLELKL